MSRAGVAAVIGLSVLVGAVGPAGADPDASLSGDGFVRIADSVDNALGGSSGGSGGSGGGGGGVSCWRRYGTSAYDEEVIGFVHERGGREIPGGDYVAFFNSCRDLLVQLNTTRYWEPESLSYAYDPDHFLLWEIADVPPGTPLEVPLLQELWAVLATQLEGPEPVVTPPAGEPVVIDHFTFEAVDNPQDDLSEGPNCAPAPAADVCVTIDAVPTLRFDPGDGSGVIECEPEGTAYDPENAGTPREQAAGGCAHSYSQRSVEGFPGRVEVVWDVTWASTGNGGISGAFDPLVLPGGDEPNAVRVVDESQAVVDSIDM
jgi:hypothetical protein